MIERAGLTRDMRDWGVSIALWQKIGEIAASEHSAQLEGVYTAGLGEKWCSAGTWHGPSRCFDDHFSFCGTIRERRISNGGGFIADGESLPARK